MPTFETLPRFEKDWKGLTPQQRDTFRKVAKDTFVPDLMAPNRPFLPGLRVKGVKAHANVFEMTWDNDGRATFSYGAERLPGQPHVIWRRIGTHDIFTRHRAHNARAMPSGVPGRPGGHPGRQQAESHADKRRPAWLQQQA